ncbi:MAG: four helix bundle protein [Acidimicrobiia bacterium]|nr:four helix bundle protein [Acidimicrobiia bacterium]NNL48404.1 four helix bundle protein [Acidimicrobiia bacterium]
MRPLANYKVLDEAHRLVLAVYRSTGSFPKDERFGLRSQLRRAATSISLNIAEGTGRKSDRDFAKFLSIASGSAGELEYGIRLGHDLGYFTSTDAGELTTHLREVRKMLSGLLRVLTADR